MSEKLDDSKIPRLEEYDDGCQYLINLPIPEGVSQAEWVNELRKAAIFGCDWLSSMLDYGWTPELGESIQVLCAQKAALKARVEELEINKEDDRKFFDALLKYTIAKKAEMGDDISNILKFLSNPAFGQRS